MIHFILIFVSIIGLLIHASATEKKIRLTSLDIFIFTVLASMFITSVLTLLFNFKM